LLTELRAISQKQDGRKPPPYVITRVGWKGTIPPGLTVVELRSRYFQFAPHIAVTGESDLADVHRLQAGLKVIALEHWGKSNQPSPPASRCGRSAVQARRR
jgi:hypothetical protein